MDLSLAGCEMIRGACHAKKMTDPTCGEKWPVFDKCVLVNGECDRDRARSRADVGDGQRSSANEVAGGVDERLGLRPRDEDAGIDREAETVELLEAA